MLKTFISADWSKHPNKRSVYTADIANKRLQKEKYPETEGWNLKSLLELAKKFSRSGPVLVGVDVVLGVPQEYWQMLMQDVNTDRPDSFKQWLGGLDPRIGFFGICNSPEEWSVHRPWFKVPEGEGALSNEEREYSCPILGCQKVFRGSRSGWDTHIASPGKHPAWNPDVSDGEERKNLFKLEHDDWFRY